MATPSVLTVPSMYGDGILYSGPSAYGSELATQPVDLQVDFQSAPQGGVIVDANTFTTSGGVLEGIRSKDAAFVLTIGTAFEIEIRGTTTSNGITLGSLGNSGNEYGSGFGVHRFVSLNNRLWIRQNSAGTTTITHFSIRQVTQGSDFEFTRATTGTRINEDGYIEDVPYNLVTYSEDYSNSGWTKTGNTTVSLNDTNAPNNTLTASTISGLTGSGSNDLALNTGINPANKTYNFSVYLKGTGTLRLHLSNNVDDSASKIVTLTSSWVRYELIHAFNSTSASLSAVLDDNGATATTYKLWGAQLVKGDQQKKYLPTTDRLNLPRLNYPVYGGCPSLLLEPQRTNLFPYSNDYTQSNWTKANVTITENAGISPENLNNASKMIASANASFNYIYDALTGVSSKYTISAFVKADGRNIVWLYTQSVGTNGIIYFDLSDESMQIVAGTAGTPTGTITSFPNGWYRITSTSHTFTLSSGSGIGISDAKGSLVTTTDGTNGVLIYGLQIEAGSYATSLIHTSGATVTRNQDVAKNAGLGTTDTFNDSEGVLYAEIAALADDSTFRSISINADSTRSDQIMIRYRTNSNVINFFIRDGGSVTFNQNVTGQDITEYHKVALKYKNGDIACWVDGEEKITSTATGMPSGLSRLGFVLEGASVDPFVGKVKALAVYKTALTDTELANLTSYNNHDLFIPYRSRMQMIGADQELQCTEHDITRFL